MTQTCIHYAEPGARPGAPPLLLLHGTGGDERDLVPLARRVSPGSEILSLRGQVLERGMPRFFRRLSEGVFDEADLMTRADDLAAFVTEWRRTHPGERFTALGYSNGANIAAALLLLHPGLLSGAVLMRAMAPLATPPAPDLAGTRVLMLSGAQDPIVPLAWRTALERSLRNTGAEIENRVHDAGHGLVDDDLTSAARWLGGSSTARIISMAKRRADVVGIFPNDAAIAPPTILQLFSGKCCCDVILCTHDMAKVFGLAC
ncbi:alpha/beta hydrolase [Gluconacetobacter sacchari]|uniref:Alpha/beta hydrolase n=3 Tax=Gluconacetobacter sacchari TaxID=92759 RepID=A0A7W4IH83_9PROT|nr:alpha/beta hydrolase [Gluconacetobacter sacchari]MBB2162805.1 alpha/beta hydrolase [Gluconacetobacter sacchari]